jgi:hypothetical protein
MSTDPVDRMVARLERIDATFAGWDQRFEAQKVLIHEDPVAYMEAVRRRTEEGRP